MSGLRQGIAPLLWCLFVLSGFSGLVYQSMWSQYLGLVLGHAAYAQALVLAVFMGGMALGAWAAGRAGLRWTRLLGAYALAEALIGVLALAFHRVFLAYTGWSSARVLPALGEGLAGQLYPLVSASLLILPACLLLGATFPLLSVGLLRRWPRQDARVLGGLYAANSLGAALGALLATFVLLPRLGMPGAMAVAGGVNLVVAAATGVLSWRIEAGAVLPAASGKAPSATSSRRGPLRALLWAGMASGACSFAYEIGWVRLLNQALGTTLHGFELMLASFLLGLAAGGAWIRRRAAQLHDPLRAAGWAQVLMGVAALLSLLALSHAFDWTAALLSSLDRNDGGYRLYLLGTAAMALLVMLPTAFFAGMTLPLFTLALLRGGAGEAGIGRLYAANTVGAIVGVLLTVHVLIPIVGVRWALLLAAATDAAIGLWLLTLARQELPPARLAGTAVAVAAVLALVAVLGRPDPRAQLSSVFRTGHARLNEAMQVRFLRDGKTATIGVARSRESGVQSLLTNGKSDGAMATRITDPPAGDELTMVTLGALPLALHPRPEQVGVIGWGLGMSTHTVLGSPQVRRVETAEIESMVLQAAPLFAPRIGRALNDPRSQVRVDDARHLFSSGNRRYDVIVSEPSNPWVSGVGGLFTYQFYGFLHAHLQDGGVLVQWLQTYEIDDALLASIVAALLQAFPDAQLYLAQDNDLVLVACRGTCPAPDIARWGGGALARETRRVGLDSNAALSLRHLGGRALLQTYVSAMRARPNDDFHPQLALDAPRTRFRGDRALTLQRLAESGLPVLDLMDGQRPPEARIDIPEMPGHRLTELRARALRLAASLRNGRHESPDALRERDAAAPELALQALLGSSRERVGDLSTWSEAAAEIAAATLGPLAPQDQPGVWIGPGWIDLQAQPASVQRIMAMYAAAAARDAEAMQREGEAVLQLPAVLSARLQEQALIIAQLGALGAGAPQEVERLHQGYGVALPASEPLRLVRHMIRTRAWELQLGTAQDPGEARGMALPPRRIQALR